jgi:hypothetical protein
MHSLPTGISEANDTPSKPISFRKIHSAANRRMGDKKNGEAGPWNCNEGAKEFARNGRAGAKKKQKNIIYTYVSKDTSYASVSLQL